MKCRKFKIAHVDTPEEFEENWRNEDTNSLIHALFNFVIRSMEFSYDYTIQTDPSRLLPNGTWGGLVGLLNRSEVDFAPAPFIMMEERWDAMAYNYPFANEDFTFVSRKPSYQPEILAIFQTLSAPVWLSLFISVILVTLVFLIVLRYRYSFGDIVLHVSAISLNQEGNIISKRVGEFVLLCTWLMTMALFTTCFKSVLLSFLSFPPLTGVRNVPDLAAAIRAGKYSAMAAIEDKYLPVYLQGSPNEATRLIGENILKNPPAYAEDLLNKSFNPNVASVYPRSFIQHLEEKLHISEDTMGLFLFATAVRKDFCCRDEIDMIVHRFRAAGMDQKVSRSRGFKKAFKYLRDHPDEETLRKITLTDIAGAFIILVAGYCLSACALIIELKIERREKRRSSTV